MLARAGDLDLTIREMAARRYGLCDVDGSAATNSLMGACPVSRFDGEPLPFLPEAAALRAQAFQGAT